MPAGTHQQVNPSGSNHSASFRDASAWLTGAHVVKTIITQIATHIEKGNFAQVSVSSKDVHQKLDILAKATAETSFSTKQLEIIIDAFIAVIEESRQLPDSGFIYGDEMASRPVINSKVFEVVRKLLIPNDLSDALIPELLAKIGHTFLLTSVDDSYSTESSYNLRNFIGVLQEMVDAIAHKSHRSATRKLNNGDCIRLANVCKLLTELLKKTDPLFQNKAFFKIVVGIYVKLMFKVSLPASPEAVQLEENQAEFLKALRDAPMGEDENDDNLYFNENICSAAAPDPNLPFELFNAFFPRNQIPSAPPSTLNRFLSIFGG